MNLSHVFVDTAWVDLPYPHTPVSMLTLNFFSVTQVGPAGLLAQH